MLTFAVRTSLIIVFSFLLYILHIQHVTFILSNEKPTSANTFLTAFVLRKWGKGCPVVVVCFKRKCPCVKYVVPYILTFKDEECIISNLDATGLHVNFPLYTGIPHHCYVSLLKLVIPKHLDIANREQ